MAKLFKNDKNFVIIEAPAEEFSKIGLGIDNTIYCDRSGEIIPEKDCCYYIAVLNSIFSKNEMEDFLKHARPYSEDSLIENRNGKNMYKWLHLAGFWQT